MERNKDHQLSSSTSAPQPEINEVFLNPIIDEGQGKQEDKNQQPPDVELSGKKPRIDSPSNDNVPSQNQQKPQNLQLPYTLPPANEHQIQWQPQSQYNGGPYQVQQLQLPPHVVSANPTAVMLPQRPGYQLQGAHNLGSCQHFPQMGSSENVTWQVPAGNGMSRNPGQVPSVFYQFGYPHATYSAGPWDPSSWWGQMQAPPFYVYPFPGACNVVPPTPPQPTTNCSAASGQPSQKGVIRPPLKISQKHQLLWEAQSAENVQLWSVIAFLQSDLAELKDRLMKVETEAKPLKTSGEQLATQGTGNNLTGQTIKKGRPRKISSSVVDTTLRFPDKPHPRPRGRRPSLSEAPPVIKEISFQKDDKNKVDFMDTVSPFTSTSQHANGDRFTSIFTSNSSPIEANSLDPQMILQNPFSEQKVKKLMGEASSANQGIINSGRDIMMSAISPDFDSSQGKVSGQGNGGVVARSMVDENNNASEDLDDATAESDKEEDDEKENAANSLGDGSPPGFLSW